MHKKLFGISLAIVLIVGFIFSLTPSVAAEYACGTYSDDEYNNDCDTTDSSTPTTASTDTDSTSSSTEGTSSPSTPSSVQDTTPNTSTSSTTNAATPNSDQITTQKATKSSSQPFNWWPWIVCGTIVLFIIILNIVVAVRHRTHKINTD